MDRLLLKGGILHTSQGSRRADILVDKGCIAAIGENLSSGGAADTAGMTNLTAAADTANEPLRVVNVAGRHLFSGLVDVHVHLREPGFGYKETIASGTRAAAHGGYTTVCAMPNLDPVPDTAEHLAVQRDIIDRTAVIEVLPYASITVGQRGCGELVDFEALSPYVAGFSDDGRGVQDEAVMEAAMRRAAAAGSRIAAHCEVNCLLRGGYIHDGGYCRRNGHRGICSESEWRQVERDLLLAERTGCPYHVCHISTKESVELIRRAKARGVKVSCETAPHYLLLCDDNLREEGRFKMNPPLRSAADRDALVEGVLDGTIDVIATDHAPHSAEEKSRGLEKSAFGIVGMETAFALMYTYFVRSGRMPLERLTELMSENPRRLFGLGGGLEVGERADIAVFDLDAEYDIDPQRFLSQGRATPFEGWHVAGECTLTLAGGKTAYENRA